MKTIWNIIKWIFGFIGSIIIFIGGLIAALGSIMVDPKAFKDIINKIFSKKTS